MTRDKRRRRHRGIRAEAFRSRARKARCLLAILAQLPTSLAAIRLQDRTAPDIFWIVSQETYPAIVCAYRWRATRFDSIGPSSHFSGPNVETILQSLTGHFTKEIGLCFARAGELFFHSAR